jgi:hypothetical protein
MDGERFDRLTRTLAGQASRRRVLGMLGAALAGGVSASWWAAPARADDDDDEMTVTGLTVAQTRALRPVGSPQASCAQSTMQGCEGELCSVTCDGGLAGLGFCFARVDGHGNPFCGADILCRDAVTCSNDGDCGPREVCAQTCCTEPNKCVPGCPENSAAA